MLIQVANWNIEAITGYKPISTFFSDFSIAEYFGEEAIKETFETAFEEWKTDYRYLTELVMVLNWKIWQHYDKGNHFVSQIYNGLWEEADRYAQDNLKGEELSYFYQVTD